MKVISSLENRGISSKGTTRKITIQEGEFLNFLRSLMTAALPAVSEKDAAIQKNVMDQELQH